MSKQSEISHDISPLDLSIGPCVGIIPGLGKSDVLDKTEELVIRGRREELCGSDEVRKEPKSIIVVAVDDDEQVVQTKPNETSDPK